VAASLAFKTSCAVPAAISLASIPAPASVRPPLVPSSSRWDEAGLPVVYLAESPAGALREVCVHTLSNDEPPTYTLLWGQRPGTEFPSISEDSLSPGLEAEERDHARAGRQMAERKSDRCSGCQV
jgi:hypothetical protein